MGSNLELNKGDQFIYALDVSGSMTAADAGGGLTRIEASKEKAITLAREASKWDEDGIGLITFGHQVRWLGEVGADKAEEIIRSLKANEASTDTAGAISEAWKQHQKKGSEDQTVLFVVTDGEPNDQGAVVKVLREIASQQEAENEVFSVSFLTVGKRSAQLQAFLTMLDDDLKAKDKNGNPIDIVDVKELSDVDFMAAFAGAIGD